MKNLITDVYGTIRNNFKNILIFEVIYRIVSLTLLIRISEGLIEWLLEGSADSFLTLKNIGGLIGNVRTYPVVLLLIVFAILFAGFEMSVLYSGFIAGAQGRSTRISSMIIRGSKRYISFFKPQNLIYLVLNSVIFYGFETISIYEMIMLSRRTVDAVRELSKIKAVRFVFLIAIIAAAIVIIKNIFLVCQKAYEISSSKKYKPENEGYKKHILKIVSLYTIGIAAYTALFYLIYFVCMVIVASLVVFFTPQSYEMILVDVIGRFIKYILIFISSILSVIYGMGTTVGIYAHFASHIKGHVYDADVEYTKVAWKKKALKILGIIVLAGTVYNIADVVINGNMNLRNTFGEIMIAAHRGSSKEAPENTIPAIEKAIESFADYVEIDVRQTKDGEIVVMHDLSVFRTTGVKKNVSDMTYEEIRKLDAGSIFAREYAGEDVPTLYEVLKTCKGKANVIIEVKTNKKDSEDYIEKLVNMVESMKMEKQCMFQSSTYSVLKSIKKANNELHTGYIVAAAYGDYFKDNNVDFFSVNASYLGKENVDRAHGYGKAIFAWTVNSKSELIRMKSIGVDGIITDEPRLAREVVNGNDNRQSLVSYIRMLMK